MYRCKYNQSHIFIRKHIYDVTEMTYRFTAQNKVMNI